MYVDKNLKSVSVVHNKRDPELMVLINEACVFTMIVKGCIYVCQPHTYCFESLLLRDCRVYDGGNMKNKVNIVHE